MLSTFHSDVISVVAGGWSVREADLNALPGMIIAINDSCYRLPRFDIALSMDRLWAEHRWDFLHAKMKPTFLRRNALQNLPWKSFPWCHLFDNVNDSFTFSEDMAYLNGSNSGFCGLNLAYLLRPRELFMWGFDMCPGPHGEPYWYPPYSWNLNASKPMKLLGWSHEFEQAAEAFKAIGTKVTNVSSRSLIKSFPRVSKLTGVTV